MSLLSSVISIFTRVGSMPAIKIGADTITVDQLGAASDSLVALFSAISAAINQKNLEATAELTVEGVVSIAADLGLGEPWTGIAAKLLPIVFAEINSGTLTADLVPDGQGGFISKAWAEDPREQLNADGSFKT